MLRRLVRPVAPQRETPHGAPDLWLVPGLAIFLASFALYVIYARHYTGVMWGALDLHVYMGGGEALRHGLNPYQHGYGALHLPYTYPPITLLASTALSLLPFHTAFLMMVGLSTAAAVVVSWLTLGMLGYRSGAARLGLAGLAAGGALWLEPFQQNANLGQVNVLVMLLVVGDLWLADRVRFKGVGIGLAAGIKLVPVIFIGYLFLTGRIRAGMVSLITFAGTIAVGFALFPLPSAHYWSGKFLDSSRVASVAGVDYLGDQSLHGWIARFELPHGDLLYYLLAPIVLVAGLLLARWAARRVSDVIGMLTCAFTAVFGSPIAWTHHWVWVLPLIITGWAYAARLPGRTGTAMAVVACLPVALFGAWPFSQPEGTHPFVPYGMIWKLGALKHGPLSTGLAHHVLADLYSEATVLAMIVLAVVLWRTRPDVPERDGGMSQTVDIIPRQIARSAQRAENPSAQRDEDPENSAAITTR